MSKKVRAIPEGFHAITPYLFIDNAAAAIDFYKKVFNATEVLSVPGPDNKICHAELKIGDSMLMLADEFPEMEALSPRTLKGSTVCFNLYVEDVDSVFQKALAAGAIMKKPLQDQFYGDRSACVVDPFGHVWNIATHIEDVSAEELDRRMAAMQK